MSTKINPRLNFSSINNQIEYPDFLDIQIKSFQDFFQLETKSEERGDEGLYKTFMEKVQKHEKATQEFRTNDKIYNWVRSNLKYKVLYKQSINSRLAPA